MKLQKAIQAIFKNGVLQFAVLVLSLNHVIGQNTFNYSIDFTKAEENTYTVSLSFNEIEGKNLQLIMPQWSPGYYQIMNYALDITDIKLKGKGSLTKTSNNSWQIKNFNKKTILTYDIKTFKKFVANSYVDENHAYIIPTNTFFYSKGNLKDKVTLRFNDKYRDIATGLKEVKGAYSAENFDILYDSPILLGSLDEYPCFTVNGKKHRFLAYNPGEVPEKELMQSLKSIVTEASKIFDDIPYDEYTFIGIGPGRGGIEHLNSTTVTIDNSSFEKEYSQKALYNFLSHEYFHHYNVKRIRPFELGPFDYQNGSRTTQLWISEGLTVYYEYIVNQRAGLLDRKEVLDQLAKTINQYESNPGKEHQTLIESSFRTWQDGPFGTYGPEPDKSISYYVKGPIVGFILDLAIRHATESEYSLDDVMRILYQRYYKDLGRGFTDAEFQSVCEEVAKTDLTEVFSYVYSTAPLNYTKFFGYAGLELKKEGENSNAHFVISENQKATEAQKELLHKWLD